MLLCFELAAYLEELKAFNDELCLKNQAKVNVDL
jgi:hypothetical protein